MMQTTLPKVFINFIITIKMNNLAMNNGLYSHVIRTSRWGSCQKWGQTAEPKSLMLKTNNKQGITKSVNLLDAQKALVLKLHN